MNTVASDTPFAKPTPTTIEELNESKAYLEKHKIIPILEQVTQALVYEKPANPTEFIIRKLEAIRSSRVCTSTCNIRRGDKALCHSHAKTPRRHIASLTS
jgi:hypothetical protein